VKVVLDTNVLVSGIFYSGPPAAILRAWKQGKFRVVLTPPILEEYKDVAVRLGEHFPAIDITRIIDLVLVESELCSPVELAHPVCADPKDDKFIAAAISGKADVIVSGDKHLLKVSGYHGISILTPRVFVARILKD
jgi:putative PIN family toxin of toxin-antitoxin system